MTPVHSDMMGMTLQHKNLRGTVISYVTNVGKAHEEQQPLSWHLTMRRNSQLSITSGQTILGSFAAQSCLWQISNMQ
jgi:hypothetical protein